MKHAEVHRVKICEECKGPKPADPATVCRRCFQGKRVPRSSDEKILAFGCDEKKLYEAIMARRSNSAANRRDAVIIVEKVSGDGPGCLKSELAYWQLELEEPEPPHKKSSSAIMIDFALE